MATPGRDLTDDEIDAVLKARGKRRLSERKTAKELRMSRNTVGKYAEPWLVRWLRRAFPADDVAK